MLKLSGGNYWKILESTLIKVEKKPWFKSLKVDLLVNITLFVQEKNLKFMRL